MSGATMIMPALNWKRMDVHCKVTCIFVSINYHKICELKIYMYLIFIVSLENWACLTKYCSDFKLLHSNIGVYMCGCHYNLGAMLALQ